jgi:hypothetical protein
VALPDGQANRDVEESPAEQHPGAVEDGLMQFAKLLRIHEGERVNLYSYLRGNLKQITGQNPLSATPRIKSGACGKAASPALTSLSHQSLGSDGATLGANT